MFQLVLYCTEQIIATAGCLASEHYNTLTTIRSPDFDPHARQGGLSRLYRRRPHELVIGSDGPTCRPSGSSGVGLSSVEAMGEFSHPRGHHRVPASLDVISHQHA